MLQDEDFDSDTSDEDFVPEGVVESEDEPVSGVDEGEDDDEGEDGGTTGKKKGKKKRKTKKGKNVPVVAEPDAEEVEQKKAVSEEQNKKKAENLWADFLADVDDEPSPPPKPKAKVSSWGSLLGNKKTTSSSETVATKPEVPSKKSEPKKKEESKPTTVKITQVFEFAGEEVRVEKEVDADSTEAKVAAAAEESSPTTKEGSAASGGMKRSGGGLSGLVGLLDSKKQKLTTLEKTKLDWNRFKSSEGIDEELEKHKKSKHGYLDKQAFLERADVRQFEIERAMRQGKRSNR